MPTPARRHRDVPRLVDGVTAVRVTYRETDIEHTGYLVGVLHYRASESHCAIAETPMPALDRTTGDGGESDSEGYSAADHIRAESCCRRARQWIDSDVRWFDHLDCPAAGND